jgi:hypothetical protein
MSEVDSEFVKRAAGVQGIAVPQERIEILAARVELAQTTTRSLAADLEMEAEPASFVAFLQRLKDTE